ncbi:MAG TPA: aromatic ring-hydroxylating dioxygenase subunit alpha [Candidatus Binataceae bacterium]|nr:aromatic ring-hydroxylating dioxygenase subunit alpha [Candidatus Binataceae bacterium]
MFVNNAWYVAAYADELTDKPLARRILNQPVVLFRSPEGTVAALEDRCCHRGAPLSYGALCAQGIECGYHGLIYDVQGRCVLVPGGHRIPPNARVRSYPVVEKDGFVWLWTGDPTLAQRIQPMDYPWSHDPAWSERHDMYPIRSSYLMMVDNLMDLTHLGYVHGRTIGGTPSAHVEARMRVEKTPDGVRFVRWMLNSPPPPTYVKAGGFTGLVDRCQEFRFVAPSTVLQWTGAVDAGVGAYQPASPQVKFAFRLFHGMTPETETSCFYFWSMALLSPDRQPWDELFNDVAATFKEDQAIVEAQQARLSELPDPPLVEIHGDGATLQARALIERLIAQERAQPPTAAVG